MKEVPNDLVDTLLRCLPVVLDATKADYRDTRLVNAVRQCRRQVERLRKSKCAKKR